MTKFKDYQFCTLMHFVREVPSVFPFFSCRFWKVTRKKRWLIDLYRCGIKFFLGSWSLLFGIPPRLRLILISMVRKVCWPSFMEIKVHMEDWRFCFVSAPRGTWPSCDIKILQKGIAKYSLKTHQEHYMNKFVVLFYIANLLCVFLDKHKWRRQNSGVT